MVVQATLLSAVNLVFRKSPSPRAVLTVSMGSVLGEVQDAQSYVTVLKVSPTGKCSSLDGWRIKSQSSNHLEQANCRRRHGNASFHVSSHGCLQKSIEGAVISEVGSLLHCHITFTQPGCRKD